MAQAEGVALRGALLRSQASLIVSKPCLSALRARRAPHRRRCWRTSAATLARPLACSARARLRAPALRSAHALLTTWAASRHARGLAPKFNH